MTIVGTLPEAVVAVGILYLYYRFAPSKIKKSFGLGYLYTKEHENHLHLGRHITILSLAEGIVFGIIAVILIYYS